MHSEGALLSMFRPEVIKDYVKDYPALHIVRPISSGEIFYVGKERKVIGFSLILRIIMNSDERYRRIKEIFISGI